MKFVLVFLCSILICNADWLDLTYQVDESTLFWPTTRPFKWLFERISDQDNKWYAMNEFCIGEHVGTHLDAPYHFYKKGWKVGDIPIERLIGKAVVIDLEHKFNIYKENTTLRAADIEKWEEQNGKIEKGSIVFVRFGYSKFYGKPNYFDIGKTGGNSFPGLSEDSAGIFVKRGVYGVGVDTPSTDRGDSKLYLVHRRLAENNLYAMENVNLTATFLGTGYCAFVMPMKIRQGTGAPVRIAINKCNDTCTL